MSICFSSNAYERYGLPITTAIEKGGSMGYEGMEVNFKEWPSELDVQRLKKALDANNLRASAVGTFSMFKIYKLHLASPNEYIQRRGIEYVKECIPIAEELGTNIIQIGASAQGIQLEAPYDISWRNCVEGLREAARSLRGNMILAVEPANRFEGSVMHTVEDALKVRDEVGSDRVQIMGDIFHLNIEEKSIEDAIRRGGRHLRNMHIADNNHLAPGWGHIDFRAIFEALRDIGYDGPLTVTADLKPNPDDAMKQALSYVKKMVG